MRLTLPVVTRTEHPLMSCKIGQFGQDWEKIVHIERIKTKQGHPVPKTAHSPKGPFPPELFEQPEVITDYTPQPDGGDEDMPLGSTAQNDFKPIKWFRCKLCRDLIPEPQLGTHNCEETDGED